MGRTKTDRVAFPTYRVEPDTIESLKQTAIECGLVHGDGAAVGALLDRLAKIDRDLLKIILQKT
jgi:hypothetical protein